MATDINFSGQQYFGFDPRTIAGCSVWLDAADTNTVTLSGSSVTQWTDKSGNANNCTVSGTPTYTTTIGGNLTITTPSGSYLNNSTYTISQPFTAFVVCQLRGGSSSGSGFYFPFSGTINTSAVVLYTSAAAGRLVMWAGTANVEPSPTVSYPGNDVPTLYTSIFNGSSSALGINGRVTTGLNPGTNAKTGIRMGTDWSGATQPGDWAEVIIYNTSLGISERQQVEGYLAWKWKRNSTLPTSHSFKYYPPAMRLFQPIDLDGSLMWFDAADTSTGSLTISGSSTISTWKDKSGNGRNATQATSTRWPLLRTNQQNGLSVVEWDGVDDNLSGTFTYPTTGLTTLFVAYNQLSTTGNLRLFDINGNGYGNFGTPQQGSAADVILWLGSGGRYTTLAPATGWRTYSVNYASGSTAAWRNGTSQTLTSVGTFTATPTGTGFTLGSIATGGSVEVFRGQLGELVLYNGNLTTFQRQQMEGYLMWKWGLSLSLPTTHPFYRAPPSTPLFTPTLLSNCVFWIDAAEPSTVTSNASSVVTQVADKSPSGRNITNTLTTTGFTWNITKFNSIYPSFYYNSTQNVTLGSNSSFSISQPATVFTVQQVVGSAANQDVFDSTNSGNRMFGFYFINAGTANYRIYAGATLLPPGATSSLNPVLYSHYFNGATSQIFENGTSTISGNAGTQGSTGITIGSRFTQNTETFQGHIAEVIYFSRRLSDAERWRVEGYLAWKWGLQRNLSTSHPYYKFRP